MFERSDLVPVVESAFAPLECVAELKQYDHAFGFAVYLPGNSRVTYEEKNASRLQDANFLRQAILGVRHRIEARGVKLAQWSLPTRG